MDTEWHDKHYSGSIQPIEFMEANFEHEEFVGFLKGNIVKYIARMGRKDAPIQEAEKIVRYAKWLVAALKREHIDPRKN